MTVITRFAPSPTGYLHIGGARTALFNYLFARHNNGKYLVRIEDTDKKRSTSDAVTKIKEGLSWLGLKPDEEYILQSENLKRHQEIAKQLVQNGSAYYCYTTKEELDSERIQAKIRGENFHYNRFWRDNNSPAPKGIKPTVRLKVPLTGRLSFRDLIQGDVGVENKMLDDYILLRADGTPTYMLSVVVDDIDMKISHIIRGNDHLNNAYRQYHLFNAICGSSPKFAHLPLIHGTDGKKLSKRHGAMALDVYGVELGYLSDAVKNYLTRLGWSHGDDEIFTETQAIEWFSLDKCGKSAAKMDFKKLENLNAHYLRNLSDNDLLNLIIENFQKKHNIDLSSIGISRITQSLPSIRQKLTTLNDFYESCLFYQTAPTIPPSDPKIAKMLTPSSKQLLGEVSQTLCNLNDWTPNNIEHCVKSLIDENGYKFGEVAGAMRAVLSGTTKSPSVFELCHTLKKEETLKRLSSLK